jgi:hypothetical protein
VTVTPGGRTSRRASSVHVPDLAVGGDGVGGPRGVVGASDPRRTPDAAGRLMGADVAVLWPMVALVLVLFGATIATSGRTAPVARGRSAVGEASWPTTADRSRSDRDGGDRPGVDVGRGGRRSTDRLPGDRLMVVVTPDDGGRTVRAAVDAAHRSGASIAFVGDAATAARTYDSSGALQRADRTAAVNQRG